MELKNVHYGALLDCYEPLLTEKQRKFLDLHYNCDFSLHEIAEAENISRQGVHDAIRRAETQLNGLEEALQVQARSARLCRAVEELELALMNTELSEAAQCALHKLKTLAGE